MTRWRRLLVIGGAVALFGLVVAAAIAIPILRALDAQVVETLNGRRWDFPSRIFSDAFLLYPGLDVTAAGFVDRLQRLGYRRADGDAPLRKGDFRQLPGGYDVVLHDVAYPGEPPSEHAVHLDVDGTALTAMHDIKSGEELFSLQLEPEVVSGLFDTTWEARREVHLDALPPLLPRAVLVVEDRRFFDHHGVDPVGILRAAATNVRSGSVVQGGSTLTQQLIKNFFLSEERTFRRKVQEAVMALLVERRYEKNEILDAHLNEL